MSTTVQYNQPKEVVWTIVQISTTSPLRHVTAGTVGRRQQKHTVLDVPYQGAHGPNDITKIII